MQSCLLSTVELMGVSRILRGGDVPRRKDAQWYVATRTKIEHFSLNSY